MAKPRIFISSTFYDLRQIRLDLDRFIKEMGYEPIRNEQGNIPYGKEEKLEEYCYKEIGSIDILVSIIGGRYGSASAHGNYSISQMELNTATKLDKQIFIFIEKNVYSEYRTYLLNKENEKIRFHYVDNFKVYEFIEYLESLSKNNPIQPFESSEDIIYFLRDQWAGLFQRFLQEQRRIKETNLLNGLEKTANTLNQLINYLTEEKKDNASAIRDILLSNHPVFERLKTLLSVPYRIFFLTRDELKSWLKARNFSPVDEMFWDNDNEEEWIHKTESHQQILKMNSALFDIDGNLNPYQKHEWKDGLVNLTVTKLDEPIDDLPF